MARKKSRIHILYGLLGIILLGVGSWAFYSLINQGASDFLAWVGVTNFYLQTLIVIAVVLVGLIFSGAGIWKAIESLVKK